MVKQVYESVLAYSAYPGQFNLEQLGHQPKGWIRPKGKKNLMDQCGNKNFDKSISSLHSEPNYSE